MIERHVTTEVKRKANLCLNEVMTRRAMLSLPNTSYLACRFTEEGRAEMHCKAVGAR